MISTKFLKKILFYTAVTLGGVSLIFGVGWGAIFFEFLVVSIECAAAASAGYFWASAAAAVAATGVAIKNSLIQDP
jgi:hypothetical protein